MHVVDVVENNFKLIANLKAHHDDAIAQDATIEGNAFSYPSASRRALGGSVAEFDAVGAFGISSGVAAQARCHPRYHRLQTFHQPARAAALRARLPRR